MSVEETEPTELAPAVWRCGTELVNWYLVEEDGRVTIVDAGLPGYRPQLDRALARMGRSLGDVATVLLTHAHVDQSGSPSRSARRPACRATCSAQAC